jgi:hypothetical protein
MSTQYNHTEREAKSPEDLTNGEVSKMRQRISVLEDIVQDQSDELKRLKKELTKVRDNINIISVTLRNRT